MFVALVTLLLTAEPAASAPPSAEEALKAYDHFMAPSTFQAVANMTAHRDDGTTRTYKMTILKGSDSQSRIWFHEPASARGQEILRNGDNSWIYMPNLKRAMRLASRDSFQGGDFNNADVLRGNYAVDYTATLHDDPSDAKTWVLELRANTSNAAYDQVRLWVAREPLGMPVRGDFLTSNGKKLRSAVFTDVKDFGHGHQRPAHVTMKNEIATERWSELSFESIDVTVTAPATRFAQTDLGR